MATTNVSGVLTSNAVAVDDTATLVVAAKTLRKSVIVRNVAGSDTVYVAGSDTAATDTAGFPVAAGEALTFEDYSGPLYAACAAGMTADVRFVEVG